MFKDTITRLRDVTPLQSHFGQPHISDITRLMGCRHDEITALTARTVTDNEELLLFMRTNRLRSKTRSHEAVIYHRARQVLRPYTLQYDRDQSNYRLV